MTERERKRDGESDRSSDNAYLNRYTDPRGNCSLPTAMCPSVSRAILLNSKIAMQYVVLTVVFTSRLLEILVSDFTAENERERRTARGGEKS